MYPWAVSLLESRYCWTFVCCAEFGRFKEEGLPDGWMEGSSDSWFFKRDLVFKG